MPKDEQAQEEEGEEEAKKEPGRFSEEEACISCGIGSSRGNGETGLESLHLKEMKESWRAVWSGQHTIKIVTTYPPVNDGPVNDSAGAFFS